MYPSSPVSGIKSMIGIAAGKGGVGKSTVTVNLALALQKMGLSVGILDADVYGPSIRRMLSEEELPSQSGERIYPAIAQGIKVMSMGYFKKEGEASAVRAPIANRLIGQFIQNVAWGVLDVLLIDFPPGTGDVQLTISQSLNLTGGILVTTPQEVSLIDVRKAKTLFDLVNIPILGVVENMSYFQTTPESERLYLFGRGGGDRLAREIGCPLLASIPIDPLLGECGDSGTSLFLTDPSKGRVVKEVYEELAQWIRDDSTVIEAGLENFELCWRSFP